MFLSLLAGLLVRVAIAPWTEQRWDAYTNRLMGAYIFGYGINPFFPETSCSCSAVLNYSYPPIWLMLITPLFRLWLSTTSYTFSADPTTLWAAWGSTGNLFEAYRSFIPPNLPLLDLLFKTPVILSDLAMGYLIWLMGGRTAKAAKVSLLAWVFNPYVITIGSIWGQFDSIAALFLLLSVHYVQKDKFFLSGISLALGAGTKLFPAIVFFPVVFYLLVVKRSGLTRFLSSFFAAIAITLSSVIVFPNALDYIIKLLIGRTSPNFGGTPFFSGLTWMLVFNQVQIPTRIPIFLIVLPMLFLFFMFMFRKILGTSGMVLPFVTVAFSGVYLSYPSINVQYAIWVLPMFAVLLASRKVSKWSVVLLSAVPLSYLVAKWNPIYLVSPAIIFDENNYLPASDVVKQLWNFPTQLYVVLAAIFTITVILTIYDVLARTGVLAHPIWTGKGSE